MAAPRKKVIICGGGIIGSACCYYLTKLGEDDVDVTLVERFRIAGCASGKAGGFLAFDWCDHGPLKLLARKSFELHKELVGELGKDYGFRKVETLSVSIGKCSSSPCKKSTLPAWVDGNVSNSDTIGTTETTAQVHPEQLTNCLVEAAKARGARIVNGAVQSILFDKDGKRPRGVVVDGNEMVADAVIVAMGPWSGAAVEWFPKAKLPSITGHRAHSILLDASVSPHMLFLNIDSKDPEMYPRPDGTLYVGGNGDEEPLPEDPAQVEPDAEACADLLRMATSVCSDLKSRTVLRRQACYLPIAPDGLPLIGTIPYYEDCYIAAGHTCWGILNAPATGLAIAELLLKGEAKSVQLKHFDPRRFL